MDCCTYSHLLCGLLFTLSLIPGTQLVLSPLPVYFIESAAWNTYCNTSSYARLSGDDASVWLSASYPSTVEHRLYGSCLLSMANADKDSSLHVTFTKYPALHDCVSGILTIYEKVDSESRTLWSGQCGDAPHTWPPRLVKSRASEIWIWYHKWREWPSIIGYSGIEFEMLVSTQPYPGRCDDSLCSFHGRCTSRSADPPPNIETFDNMRLLHQCHCVQPYTGVSCQSVKLEASNYNPCQPEPCHNNGRCVRNSSYHSGFFCDCPQPFNGDMCQYSSAVCLQSIDVCGEHGICAVRDNKVICDCDQHWIGARCNIETACARLTPCQRDGVCRSSSVDEYTCICVPPWSGENCTTERISSTSTPNAGNNTANTSSVSITVPSSVEEQAETTDSDESDGPAVHPGVVAFLLFLCTVLLMICTVWIYNARKYNNEGRRRHSAGAHHVSEVQPARTRWREVRRLFPSVTNLYQKMTLPRLLQFLRPNLRKPDTARSTVPETTVVNMIDATESTSEVAEDYIVTEYNGVEMKTQSIERLLNSAVESDIIEVEAGETPSTTTDTNAQVTGSSTESSTTVAVHTDNDRRYATLMPYYTILQNHSGNHSLPLQQRRDIKQHRKRIASILQNTNL